MTAVGPLNDVRNALTAEITAAGFEKVTQIEGLLEENYFVKFRRK